MGWVSYPSSPLHAHQNRLQTGLRGILDASPRLGCSTGMGVEFGGVEGEMHVTIGIPKEGKGFKVWRISHKNRYFDVFVLGDTVIGVGIVNVEDFNWNYLGDASDERVLKRIAKIAAGLLREVAEITS